MKKIITSILSLTMCASLLVGATFSLFTSESKTNVAVSSGKVDVVATLENLELYSPTLIQESSLITDKTNAVSNNAFANGGTATIKEGTLTLSNVAPGDKVTFDIIITNNSSIAVKYRTVTTVTQNSGLFEGLNVQIGSSYDGSLQYSQWDTLNVGSQDKVINCSVELPITAGNTYMNKTCSIAFSVEAVQNNVVTYNVVKATKQTELNTAVTDITVPTEIMLTSGTYTFPTASLTGKTVALSSEDNATLDMTGVQIGYFNNVNGANIILDGLTVNWVGTEGYQGFKNAKVVYKDCIINGLQFLYSDAEFINCTFTNMDGWSVWTYGAENVNFTDCTFITGGHAVLVYNEATNEFENHVNFTGCTFLSTDTISEQYGHEDLVEVGDNPSKTNVYNITFTDCSYLSARHLLHGNKNNIPNQRLSVSEIGTKHIAGAFANTQATLDSALSASNDVTVYLATGNYELYNASYGDKKITLSGVGDVVIETGKGNEFYSDQVTFNNVTVKFPEVSHKGLTHTNKVVYNQCTLVGTQTLYAATVEFNDCVFEGNDGKDIYYVWTYGIANAIFKGCTFNTNGKAILCYAEGTVTSNVTLTDCKFYSDGTIAKNKAAVEVGTDNHKQTYFITFTNCIQSGFAVNNSTNALWGNKNSMSANNLSVKIDGVEQNNAVTD